jgi:hypothetical protein
VELGVHPNWLKPVRTGRNQHHASEDRHERGQVPCCRDRQAEEGPKNREAQARTPDGAPVWVVRLTAIEADRGTAETIWVEVVGDEPKVTLDDLVQVTGLAFAPWVNREHKIVRSFRADAVTAPEAARRAA